MAWTQVKQAQSIAEHVFSRVLHRVDLAMKYEAFAEQLSVARYGSLGSRSLLRQISRLIYRLRANHSFFQRPCSTIPVGARSQIVLVDWRFYAVSVHRRLFSAHIGWHAWNKNMSES